MDLINPIIFEQWLPITDIVAPGIRPYYYISNFGRIYSVQSNKILTTFINNTTGYCHIGLRLIDNTSKHFTIHRLVMKTFVPIDNSDEFEVNHINGNKLDNCILNLEWCVRKDNIEHAWNNNLYHVGEAHHNSNLTNDQVHIICKCLEKRMSYDKIAEAIGLKIDSRLSSCISDIRHKRRWTHISRYYAFPTERSYQLLNDDQIHLICKCFEDGIYDYKYIFSVINIDIDSMSSKQRKKYIGCLDRIRRKDRFINISKEYNF